MINVLIIGGGGREHALAWGLKRAPDLGQLYAAPGNAGIAELAECVALDRLDFAAVIAFVRAKDIGLVVVGPEVPLVAGLGDALRAADILVFGPDKAAAQLEGSKAFTKEICRAQNIPTATYAQFEEAGAAHAYVDGQGVPIVIKADGLAAGKGVVVAQSLEEAHRAIDEMFDGAFGAAGATLVIEEFLAGEEASFFALSDGQTVIPLASAQDHKRVGEGDTGPNTGGMGAYSPAPVLTPALQADVMDRIIQPTIAALRAQGIAYKGVLYAGLMLTDDGPKLIEYNCRFGDPETQVVIPRLKTDLLDLLLACATGRLADVRVELKPTTALTVVMAAKGYPGSYAKGSVIKGVDQAAQSGALVFHAGTRLMADTLTAQGGRVLNITGLGDDLAAARAKAYAGIDAIDWSGGFYRRDIGKRRLR